MKEKYLVSLQEIQNALDSNGGIDTGDISWDSLKDILELVQEQEKEIEENKKYIVNLTDEQYRKLVDVIRNEINKKWEDKIKAKIEEIQNRNENYIFDKLTSEDIKRTIITNLQSLLEKENNNE